MHGQLAIQDKAGKFPLVVLYQYAGVYPLKKEFATLWSDCGWMVLNIIAQAAPRSPPAMRKAGSVTAATTHALIHSENWCKHLREGNTVV